MGVGGRQCCLRLNPHGTLSLWAAQGPRTVSFRLFGHKILWLPITWVGAVGSRLRGRRWGLSAPTCKPVIEPWARRPRWVRQYASCVCCPAHACDYTGAPVTSPHRPVLFPRLVPPQGGPSPGPCPAPLTVGISGIPGPIEASPWPQPSSAHGASLWACLSQRPLFISLFGLGPHFSRVTSSELITPATTLFPNKVTFWGPESEDSNRQFFRGCSPSHSTRGFREGKPSAHRNLHVEVDSSCIHSHQTWMQPGCPSAGDG